ncbi:hypothetical protein LUZ63_015607 [Rhynchospora breviuscula]|uniref:F-box domain-containing protein n=1 Tax=Rhynchospora breviuscula TaxID=2022672 RepID=A0A9Q0HMC4_9POAL|nr:hypothetical protein LUZ63_015607 [Rhynchospora breviuscula]
MAVEERDWAKLPRNVLMLTFCKLGMHQVLLRASSVCKPWREVAKNPTLWRRIDMGMSIRCFRRICKLREENSIVDATPLMRAIGTEMTKVAVKWGGNCVEQLLIGPACDANLFNYVADRARNLKSLSIIDNRAFCNVENMAKTLGQLKQLEELSIVRCTTPSGMMMKVVGTKCPQLKRLKIINPFWSGTFTTWEEGTSTQLGIPEPMLQLEVLQLVLTSTTTVELMKIVERCPNLEILDLRSSPVQVTNDDIRNRCSKLHTLILPHDIFSQARNQYCDHYGDMYTTKPLII